jgi:hypothetical protein
LNARVISDVSSGRERLIENQFRPFTSTFRAIKFSKKLFEFEFQMIDETAAGIHLVKAAGSGSLAADSGHLAVTSGGKYDRTGC